MKNRFDTVLGAGKISLGKEHIKKVHTHLKNWKEKQREGLLSGYKRK